MPEIEGVENTTHRGKDGFIIEWSIPGVSKSGAKFKAVGSTSMRFPSTVTEIKVVGISEASSDSYNTRIFDKAYTVRVFVPTEGFLSAGIKNPVEWLKDQFSGDILNI